jgi:hypothetical protein
MRAYFAAQLQQITPRRYRSKPPADYEVQIVDTESRGLIVIWDFGWASRRYGNMRIITDALEQGAHHSTHYLGDVSIAPRFVAGEKFNVHADKQSEANCILLTETVEDRSLILLDQDGRRSQSETA